MLWRLRTLDWKYAAGELLIVTVGVLIALAINQWNDRRLEYRNERQLINQLIEDLQADIDNTISASQVVKSKEASLIRLQTALNADLIGVSNREFLEDVVAGADLGWNQGRPMSVTFEEVRNSGRFSLIRNPDLRKMISAYYLNWQDYSERADERETRYPELSYLLVPRRVVLDQSPTSTGQVTNLRLDPNISSDEIADLVETVRASEISRYIPGELNFARFVHAMMGGIENEAAALVKALEDYGSSLDN